MYGMKNLKRNICWTFKEDLLLYVPSVISQSRSSGVFLGSITSTISIIGFIYSNERRVTLVLVKLQLKLHKSSILAPFVSDEPNANVSREEPECHNYLLRTVLAYVFSFCVMTLFVGALAVLIQSCYWEKEDSVVTNKQPPSNNRTHVGPLYSKLKKL